MFKRCFLTGLFLAIFTNTVNAGDLELGIYELNRGEFKKAIAQFQPLVEEKYSPAQYQMGLIHLNGWGVKKSPKKAFELFSLAATQNHPEALFDLANMYTEGAVTKKNLETAFVLMEKAANKQPIMAIKSNHSINICLFFLESLIKDATITTIIVNNFL